MDAPVHTPVGRIDAERSPFQRAIDAYADNLRLRRKKPDTVRQFCGTIKKAAEERGWETLDDFNYANVTGYLASKIDASEWKPQTHNHKLSMFNCFADFLVAEEMIDRNPLAKAYAIEEDEPMGARPVTLDEIRRHILVAAAKQLADGRARGDRALYWLALVSAGWRVNEPKRLKGLNLRLDDDVPHVAWFADMHKAKRAMDVALAPELADMLRAHVKRMNIGPNDPAFPSPPGDATWRIDGDLACIPYSNHRGKVFTPHSARHTFDTIASEHILEEKMIDYLMRHRGKVEARYYTPSLKHQAEAVAKLPRFWPTEEAIAQEVARQLSEKRMKTVDVGNKSAMISPTLRASNETSDSVKPPRFCVPPERHSEAASLRGLSEFEPAGAGRPPSGVHSKDFQDQNGHSGHGNERFEHHEEVARAWEAHAASLLAAARLLRDRSQSHGRRID